MSCSIRIEHRDFKERACLKNKVILSRTYAMNAYNEFGLSL